MKFLADENFNNDILRGVWRRVPDAQMTRVQDTAIAGAPDDEVLRYAAEQEFLVLTHDVNTMRNIFYTRLNAGLSVPGVFLVVEQSPIAPVIDSLELIILASDESDWAGKIEYLPLR